MFNLNGGTTVSGTSLGVSGMYVGVLLLRSGDIAIAIAFLVLTSLYLLVVVSTLCRYFINYRRNKYVRS